MTMDSIKVGGLPSSFFTALLQFQILTRLLSRPRSWVNSLQAAAAAHMTDKPDIFEAAQNGSIVLLNSHIVMDPACVTRRDDRSIALLLNLCFVFFIFDSFFIVVISLYTPLNWAALYGHPDMCKLLVRGTAIKLLPLSCSK